MLLELTPKCPDMPVLQSITGVVGICRRMGDTRGGVRLSRSACCACCVVVDDTVVCLGVLGAALLVAAPLAFNDVMTILVFLITFLFSVAFASSFA